MPPPSRSRGDAREKRTFLAVLLVALGGVLLMLWLDPGDAANAALLAYRRQQAERAGSDPVRLALASDRQPGDAVAGSLAARDGDEPPAERTEPPLVRVEDPRIAAWVDDLRDDGIAGNAIVAMRGLLRLPAGSIPELHGALGAVDTQLRHFAGGLLRGRCRRQLDRVTPELLDVSIQALRSDLGAVSMDAFATPVGPILQNAVHFLAQNATAAHDLLVPQLTSGNKQQRFLSAYLLTLSESRQRTRWHADRIVFELVGHLSDNEVEGDAMMATNGLFRLGQAALPVLLDSRRYLDEQGRQLVDLIQLDLRQPPRTKGDFYRRGAMANISCIYHDPAVEYDLTRSRVPGFGKH